MLFAFISTGKTTWVDYALQRRLAEGAPTLLRYQERYYLFDSDGVRRNTQQPHFNFNNNSDKIMWCFVAASGNPDGVPEEIAARTAPVFPIYVPPPNPSCWALLEESRLVRTAYMNPWCWDEMEAAYVVFV